VPVVVVRGTPYQMGWHLGQLMRPEIQTFVPAVVKGFEQELGVSGEQLDRLWASTAAFTDDRIEQELLGEADGAGLSIRLLQHAHCLPLLMPYSCSSIAAWGKATTDGHLYQTRDLDWDMAAKAHEFPVIVVYEPAHGHAHVIPTFAGFIGANCGMNDAGVVLAEMGDSPRREMPYDIQAPHFTAFFRTLLYDASSLPAALRMFKGFPHTKSYHFVFGEGLGKQGAVKIRTHAGGTPAAYIHIWRDNDPGDELAPAVLPDLVYQDEGRGAFPFLKAHYGKLDGPKMIQLADSIPIRGDNVLDAVFDGTALRLWVSYAHGDQEAYQRPYVFLDLRALLASTALNSSSAQASAAR
jgi:isopenicillin-N N-acyltransferase like protein